jgi:hypothetical protein
MKVDMSAKAVTARLKRVLQLRRLCLSLAKAKPVPPQKKGRMEKKEIEIGGGNITCELKDLTHRTAAGYL